MLTLGHHVLRITFACCEVADDILGNDNGQLDFGETSHLTLTAENIGVETAPGVTLNISTNDPILTVLDSTECLGDIPAGGTAEVTYDISASEACPQEHVAELDLTFSGGGYNGNDSFAITIGDVLLDDLRYSFVVEGITLILAAFFEIYISQFSHLPVSRVFPENSHNDPVYLSSAYRGASGLIIRD